MGVKIVRKSRLGDIKKALSEANGSRVSIGFFDNKEYTDGTPVAYIAAIQEFGYPPKNIPARSFMRTALSDNQAQLEEIISRGAGKYVVGQITMNQFLDGLGESMMGMIVEKIQSITTPPLKPSTIASRNSKRKKGTTDAGHTGNKPLVFTGTLISSVEYKVEL